MKKRPAGVPEENIYTSMHWMVIVTYALAASAVFLLISNAG
jgi:hypothetical protein